MKQKYGNRKTVVNGIKFDSKRESQYYTQCVIREKLGEITGLELQKKFPIIIDGKPVKIRSEGYPNGRAVSYIADFYFFDVAKNRWVVVDVKGYDLALSRLKRALVESIYGICVEIVK